MGDRRSLTVSKRLDKWQEARAEDDITVLDENPVLIVQEAEPRTKITLPSVKTSKVGMAGATKR